MFIFVIDLFFLKIKYLDMVKIIFSIIICNLFYCPPPNNENMTAAKTISRGLLRSLVGPLRALPVGGGAIIFKLNSFHASRIDADDNLGQLMVEYGTWRGPTAIVDGW